MIWELELVRLRVFLSSCGSGYDLMWLCVVECEDPVLGLFLCPDEKF